ncbi:putative disease resistance RPP13-like protein 1 [Pistacia vera]|uniref:putative disease resistance RPP13-like protein 1 n=1 Tax=Pistacia vera TaxID=55513 RepID=UPI00126301B1|nr:putative disease resistance RPP13-like protein 1 [Pistacia vera]
MGGVGKTTLVQLVYNDARVEDHFDLKAWTCVSEDFDVVRLTKTVLHSVDTRTDEVNDLNLLQVKLKEKLIGKKFLLVLDDIWNDDYDDWTVLRCPFEVGLPGSKIIVTTRSQNVSKIMGTLPAYSLNQLSNDACLSVFSRHSLGTNDFSMHQYLKGTGELIVRKCNGLPLAAKTLGGLLRGKYDPNDWEDVLNSNIWDLPGGIIPALRLSYHYLPPHLKRCFAYCSLFPMGYEFQEEEVILLWMAEGFLQHEIGERQMEVLGRKSFRELYARSFFQHSSKDTSWFVMHDLINDLAQWAAEEICFMMENALESDKKEKISKNLRHLSYIGGKYDGLKKFEALKDVKQLRTFLSLKLVHPGWCYLTYNVVLHILPKLQRLRVLSLHGYRIVELPNGIGYLKQLRYLDLSSTAIEILPDSISNLYNLQTLKLENCRRLKKLCAQIGSLINLQHLNNSNAHSLEEMPLSISKLTGLRTLPFFVVGKGICSGLGGLKSLMHIRETLHISRLENVDDVGDAKDASLHSMRNLNAVLLEWANSLGVSNKPRTETHVLNVLKPHQKLKELTVRGYGGTRFPTWLGDFSFSDLVILRLEDCGKCTFLPSVGQLPFLKGLFIKGMAGVKIVGLEFNGNCLSVPFPSLETLCFECMQEWENWIPHEPGQEVIGFPRLQVLSIVRCSRLLGVLPEHLPSLKRLVVKRCELLVVSVPSLPSLCKLEIDACKEVVWKTNVDLSSVSSVVLSDMSSHMLESERFLPVLPKLEELKIVGCKDLIFFCQSGNSLMKDVSYLCQLVIEQCPQLLSLVAEEGEQQQYGSPCRLQSLELRDCESLVKLPQVLNNLSSLREISIQECPKLVSFPEASLPSQLRFISIFKCNALKSLPEAWMHSSDTSLESLSIGFCDSLTCIATVHLPPNLKRLVIHGCNNLETLIDEEEVSVMHEENIKRGSSCRDTSFLEYLEIKHCPSLTSVWSKSELPATLQQMEIFHCSNLVSLSSRGNLPKALKYLFIDRCSKMESLAERVHNNTSLESITICDCENLTSLPNDLHQLRHLQKLSILDCPNFVSFAEGGLPSTKLSDFSIIGCEKLEDLPNCMHNLNSLQYLAILNCPSIVSFPEDGFPTNLLSLEIKDLSICKSLFMWGLQKLTSLRRLCISGECSDMVSFPCEKIEMKLPTSLIQLQIENFPDLECLSSTVQNLPSLEELELYSCPKLKYFPRVGLPPSLLRLYIDGCPLLQKRCRKDKGKYWSMIAHIPYVFTDWRWVFDQRRVLNPV